MRVVAARPDADERAEAAQVFVLTLRAGAR